MNSVPPLVNIQPAQVVNIQPAPTTLAHLARTKKIVFVEGDNDFKTLRRFARVLGFDDLATGNDLTSFESGGFSSWEKIKSFAWGAKKTIDANIKIFAVYDRDYFCDEQLIEIESELKKELTDAHILDRKEMENYLLNIEVLQRVLEKQLDQRNKRQGTAISPPKTIKQYLLKITGTERIDAQSQYVARKLEYFKRSHKDGSTLSKQAIQIFETKWEDLQVRMTIAPGKVVLSALREAVQADLGINLTDIQIIDEFHEGEVPNDLKQLIERLDVFRRN